MHLQVPLLVGGHKHILLLKQLAQRAILVHRHEDIRATNKLAANVQLGNRLPVTVLLDTCSSVVSKMSLTAPIVHSPWKIPHTRSKLLILEHVERGELLRVDALEAENLDCGAREATLRCLGRSLHEQHDGRGGDGLVDRCADFGGQEGLLESGEARREERVAARAEGLGGDLRDR